MTTPDALLTTAEVAALLKVHPKQVYRLLRKGLPGQRLGGEWRFRAREVLAWMAGESAAPAPAPGRAETRGDGPAPLLAANGDAVVELLLDLVNASGTALLGLVQSDRARALKLLADGAVLAAGCHGRGFPPRLGEERLARLHLVRRQVVLAYREGEKEPVLEELGARRLAARPPTAGVSAHLERALEDRGLDAGRVLAEAAVFASHRAAACAVVRREADVALVSEAWAARVGLRAVPLASEDYGLLVHAANLGAPLMVRLTEVAQSAAFARALGSAGGYDASEAGRLFYDGVDE